MVQIELVLRDRGHAETVHRIFEAVRLPYMIRAVTGRHEADHRPARSLGAETMRDIGACREYQDYSNSVAINPGSARHLHRIADAARWNLPR